MPLRTLALAPVLAAALLSSSCTDGESGGGAGASPLLATTSIWADVVSAVACGEEVASMIPPGTDAHSHEPTVQDADRLREASLVVANGLDLEDGLQDALAGARSDGVTVLEVAPLALDAEDDHAEAEHADDDHADDGHDHGGVDPHVWMDPALVAAAVPHIAEAIGQVDDLDLSAEDLERCADEYVGDLDALAEEMAAELAAVPEDRRRIVTNHESIGHFAERFGFEVIGAVVPSTNSLAETNPRDLDELEATMRDAGVEVVFADTGGSSDLARSLADRLGPGAEVVELHTESLAPGADGADASSSYLQTMRANAELVADALG